MRKGSGFNIFSRISPGNPALRLGWMNLYTRMVTLAGSIVIVYAFHHLPKNTGGLWLFIMLGVLSELTSIHLFANSRSTVSMSSIIAIASIVAIGPSAGVFTYLASGLTTAVTTSLQAIKSPSNRASLLQRTSFNAAMWSISAAVAGAVYILTGGKLVVGVEIMVVPLVLAAVAEWVVNVAIVIVVISLQTGQGPREIWIRDIRWQAPVSIAAGIIGGGFLAVAYSMFGMFGLMIVLLPVLSTSYSFRAYKGNMQGYVEGLEKLNQNLTSANDSIRRLNADLFHSLAKVFDMRDPYVGGHAAQVAVYAVAIAIEMGLPPERVELIRQAAYLHDIGKLSIPEAILHKPGRLTDMEYGFVKRHSDIGADLLASVEGLMHLAPIVRHHHERWDGHGYPMGLAGEEIPLEARILNVCDSVESMASDRPYHRALSVKAIVEEVEHCAGTQFDPIVARNFVALVTRKSAEPFVVNSARSVTQQYAASILANESLTQSMFAWVFEKEALE
jgi:putative nucleotidyltransferase with HDIG domain